MTDDDDDDDAELDELLENAVEQLRAARGNPARIEAAIQRYLEEGEALELSPEELRDYFDISTPGLVEQAGYKGEEVAAASKLFDKVSEARYG